MEWFTKVFKPLVDFLLPPVEQGVEKERYLPLPAGLAVVAAGDDAEIHNPAWTGGHLYRRQLHGWADEPVRPAGVQPHFLPGGGPVPLAVGGPGEGGSENRS